MNARPSDENRGVEPTLSGRVAVVTGAGTGIGRAIAIALARRGAITILTGRDEAALEAVASEIDAAGGDARAVRMDVRHSDEVESVTATLAAEFGRIDVLVNNAGTLGRSPLLEMSAADWDAAFATNLRGTFLCMREAAGVMIGQGDGTIINIASVWAFTGVPDYAAYCAAKSGVVSLTKTAAVEWAAAGIRVNAIAPGYVETGLSDATKEPARETEAVARVPMRRKGRPEEIGSLAAFLASPEAAYITGQTYVIDGGLTA